MQGTLRASDVEFVSLPTAVFCVQCELISANNTTRCLACGSNAVLSLSRVLGGSLRGQQAAHLIADAELDRIVRSLLQSVPRLEEVETQRNPHAVPRLSSHHLRFRHQAEGGAIQAQIGPAQMTFDWIDTKELDLEPSISLITEKAQSLTVATGAAIALQHGNEIICRARTGRTAPDLGVRLQADRGISAECVRTGEVLLCNDADSNPRVDFHACRRLGVRSILAAPLRHFRRTLGVFEVLSSRPHAFDNNDVATMQFLSGMTVAAISRISSLKPRPPVCA
jgi:putative methionine-R-sulfoxide reductase with GAF domain